MKKKELLTGVKYVYTIFDKISKRFNHLYLANNDEEFIRLYLPSIVLDNALRDLTIFKIGIFNEITSELKAISKKRVPTDCYLFPHSRLSPIGENLKPEEIEKAVQTTKNEILAQVAEDKNNKEGVENE